MFQKFKLTAISNDPSGEKHLCFTALNGETTIELKHISAATLARFKLCGEVQVGYIYSIEHIFS